MPAGITPDLSRDLYSEYVRENVVRQQDEPLSLARIAADLGQSALYSGVQSPLVGVAQILDNVGGTDLAGSVKVCRTPDETEFGSVRWHAQQLGAAAGMLGPFLTMAKGTRCAMQKLGAPAHASASWRVAEGATAGLAYEGLLRPSDPGEGEFWKSRIKHGLSGAATFGTLSAGSIGLSRLGTSHGLRLLSGHTIGSRAAIGALSGLPAGFVSAETASLLHDSQPASAKDVVESVYTMGFVGGALGAMHRAPRAEPGAEFKPDLPAEQMREVGLIGERRSEPVRVETDRPVESERPGKILPDRSVSMRELIESNDLAQADRLMKEYYPELERAFPLEGEIESAKTYLEYLRDPDSTWDMVVLRDNANKVIGGIQYQVLDVNGANVKKSAWVEHIWVREENRSGDNFRSLLKIAKDRISSDGADLVFMEFNNPSKMTAEQMAQDAEAGLETQDRQLIWGRVGIHVAVDSKGEIAPYGQPSMDGQPPVDYLSLGFIGTKALTGKTILVGDYLKVAHSAHATLPGIDLNLDPTVRAYTNPLLASGERTLTFRSLAEIAREARQGAN
jgi:hypothetical protein